MLKVFTKNLGFYISLCLLGSLANAQDLETYDAQRIADIFYKLNGDSKNPKSRVNHVKGFCASGTFTPSEDFNQSSLNLPLFREGKILTRVRYSLGGAIKDNRSKQRGMALNFLGKNDNWTMVMLNTEINFAKNPQEFGQFFEMKIPNFMNAQKIKELSQRDSYKNFNTYLEKIGISSLEHTPFYSIHTFWFEDYSRNLIPARWKFIPKDGITYLNTQELKSVSKDFLKENFITYTKDKPIEYKMYLEFANKGDILDDTTALWQGEHKNLFMGTLQVSKYEGEECNQDVYFPSELPKGVGVPKDPIFELRTPTYAITFGKRQ